MSIRTARYVNFLWFITAATVLDPLSITSLTTLAMNTFWLYIEMSWSSILLETSMVIGQGLSQRNICCLSVEYWSSIRFYRAKSRMAIPQVSFLADLVHPLASSFIRSHLKTFMSKKQPIAYMCEVRKSKRHAHLYSLEPWFSSHYISIGSAAGHRAELNIIQRQSLLLIDGGDSGNNNFVYNSIFTSLQILLFCDKPPLRSVTKLCQ